MRISRRAIVSGAASLAIVRPAASQVPASPSAAPAITAPGRPRWQRNAIATPAPDGRPAITLVIDDLGVVHNGTQRMVALPGPITLAWFPFARDVAEQVAAARARGHEAILHMPMQAYSASTAWTGPDPLRIDLPPAENLRRLQAALDAVPDTVGLNNHMGSVATRDAGLMDLVAAEARRREMLVLDSVTIGHSLAYHQAMLAGVPAAARDVFIDYIADAGVIRGQLALIEQLARRNGHVIAIGHPWPLTVEAMETWVPGLAARGFSLWPLSATVAWRNEIAMPA